MKKYLFIMSAAALALASCSEEQELVNAPASQENRVLTATFEQEATTRTSIDGENNNALTWSEGDAIAVFGTTDDEQAQYILTNGAGTASATFTLNEGATAPAEIAGAAFPYSQAGWDGSLTMNLLAELDQTSAGELNLPMWGTVVDGEIAFKHLAGVLKVNLTSLPEDYTQLIVTASNPIAGHFTADVDVSEEYPTLTPSTESQVYNTVTVNFTNEAATTIYLPLPVGTYDSIEVSVSDGNAKTKVLKKFSNINVERAKVYKTTVSDYTSVMTEEELRAAVAEGGTVTLGANITLENYLAIDKSITLNLGEYDINTVEVEDNGILKHRTALYINGEGIVVTINGTTGKVTGNQGLYINNGLVKVYGGHFHGTNINGEAVYVINNGKAEIYGGTFSGDYTNKLFVLNEYDGTRAVTDIKVYGGTFVGFDPGNNAAEGEGTNFVAEGYSSIQEDDFYVVSKGIKNETALCAAIAAAGDGNTVTLDTNITLTKTLIVALGKNITLDLNSQTITISKENDATAVTDFINQGTMTIKNGSISAGDDELTRRCIYNYGTMTIEGVNFTQLYGQKGAAINNEGTMTIQGATTVNSKYYSIWNSGNNANLTINDGTFTCDNIDEVTTPCYCVNNLDGATLTVNDGTFTGDHGAIHLIGEGTNATLKMGTFTCKGIAGKSDHVIYVPTGTTLKYNKKNCSFISEEPNGNDNGGQLIYYGGGTVEEIQG